MKNLNQVIIGLVNYCNDIEANILVINVPKGEFFIEQKDGTQTNCTFAEIPDISLAELIVQREKKNDIDVDIEELINMDCPSDYGLIDWPSQKCTSNACKECWSRKAYK